MDPKLFSKASNLSIGHFYGRIVDSKTNKGIEGVSVQLLQIRMDTAAKKAKEIPISGMITGKNGDFSQINGAGSDMSSRVDGPNGRVLPIRIAVWPESLHLLGRPFFFKFAICTLRSKY